MPQQHQNPSQVLATTTRRQSASSKLRHKYWSQWIISKQECFACFVFNFLPQGKLRKEALVKEPAWVIETQRSWRLEWEGVQKSRDAFLQWRGWFSVVNCGLHFEVSLLVEPHWHSILAPTWKLICPLFLMLTKFVRAALSWGYRGLKGRPSHPELCFNDLFHCWLIISL